MNAAIYEVNFRYIGRSWFNCGPTAGQSGALTTDQNFSKTLGAAYNQVFSENQGLMQNLTSNLQGIINAGPSQQGFSPQELAAQNSQAINAAAASNQKVQQEIGVNAAKGTANPGVESGVTQAERSSAATSVDTNLSNTEANITNANYTTGRQNYWSAVGAQESAPGAFENPANQAGSVASGANQVTDTQANATAADSTGNELLGLGEGLAADTATVLGGKKGCWIAAAVYDGWDDPRVAEARNFIFNIWPSRSYLGEIVARLYAAVGEKVARIVKRSSVLRSIFKPLFNIAVRKNREL
jgi:hypothetical protein